MAATDLELYSTLGFFGTAEAIPAKSSEVHVEDVRQFVSILTPYHFSSLVSHVVERVHYVDSEEVWFKKEIMSPELAKREVLAQELLRFYLPRQPITKLAYHPETGVHYVLSREIKGFKPLPEGRSVAFMDGTFNGIGSIMILAYFLQETDLKNGNIGLDEDGLVYKIDSDWSFSSLRDARLFPPHTVGISSYQINQLPFLSSYRTHNWFDIMKVGKLRTKSQIFERDVVVNERVLHDKFLTMSQILLTPKSLLVKMVEGLFPAGSALYLDFLLERQTLLLKEANKIPAFKAFFLEHFQQVSEKLGVSSLKFKLQGGVDLLVSTESEAYLAELFDHKRAVLTALGLQDAPALSALSPRLT